MGLQGGVNQGGGGTGGGGQQAPAWGGDSGSGGGADGGGTESDPPTLGFRFPSNAAERWLNTLYGKGYLNNAYDYYQDNQSNVVARIFLDGRVSMIVSRGEDDFMVRDFTNSTTEAVVETSFDLFSDLLYAELTNPTGMSQGTGDPNVRISNVVKIGKHRPAFLKAYARFANKGASILDKIDIHHR
jgi:hypothetical protein